MTRFTREEVDAMLRRGPSHPPAQATAPAPVSRRYGNGRRREPGTMNKTEAAYARHLESMKTAGQVQWYAFEGMTLRLAKNTRYTVDFVVMMADCSIECHDVKGRSGDTYWAEEDARVKIKVAAEMFPFKFCVVFPRASKHGGGFERVEVA